MTADQVLQAFHRDAPGLFLGAVNVAVGLVAAGFSGIRRKLDPALIYFALFAGLYGLRMWMWSDLMRLTMRGSTLYTRVSYAVDFIVAIPAFFFFKAAGLIRRQVKIAGYVLGIVLGSLALATLVFELRFRRRAKAAQPQVISVVSRLPNLAAIGPLLRPA
jgi:hypothetical protein